MLLFFLLTSMAQMIKIATILAFVAGPVLAALNTFAMFGKSVPAEDRPGHLMFIWCGVSLVTMVAFSIAYLLL
jgi:hypothetical protein